LSTEKNNFNSRILYPAKPSFKIEEGIKIFLGRQGKKINT
jgi:hypothetical protein